MISADGHVVTNNHVIENASEIRVVFSDRTRAEARLVGRDPSTDLAVLKIDPRPNMAVATWGDSDKMEPGAWTIAIGSPFGLGGTVTVGVLSARSRDIRSGPYDDFLQTDASINRGNSGGPCSMPLAKSSVSILRFSLPLERISASASPYRLAPRGRLPSN